MAALDAQKASTQVEINVAVKAGDRYEDILAAWREQLKTDLPDQSISTHEAIVQWLVGEAERFEPMDKKEITLAKRALLGPLSRPGL